MRTHAQVIWQVETPGELQGRVFAVRRLFAAGTVPVGAAIAGWSAGLLDAAQVVIVFGSFAGVGTLVLVLVPGIHSLGSRIPATDGRATSD